MLKNKTILITGSSSGIGAATARLAKEYGAKVILHGKTESPELKKFAEELNCEYIVCDVADKNAVEGEIKRILKKVKKIDALINCAGYVISKSFTDTSDDEWLDIMKVNLLGTVHFCQAVVPGMLKQKYGRIVNIASIRGENSLSNNRSVAYSTSKAAVSNFTSALTKEVAPNILANAVSPGFTLTPMSKEWSEINWEQAESNLLGRVIKPEEIANVLLFLSSERNSAITGQDILVDGGYSLFGK